MNSFHERELNEPNLVNYLNYRFPDRNKPEIDNTMSHLPSQFIKSKFKGIIDLLEDLKNHNISFEELDRLYIKVQDYLPLIEKETFKYDKTKKSSQIGIVRVILLITKDDFLFSHEMPLDVLLFYIGWNKIIISGKKAEYLEKSKLPKWDYMDESRLSKWDYLDYSDSEDINFL